MATTALGIRQDSNGDGVTPLCHRKIIQARWMNAGVISGLSVTGGSGLSYSVSAGCAVVSRADADGCCEAYFEGGSTPAVAAGGSSPRIDAVWIKANDAEQGDADNHVVVGVTSGTPSSSPQEPQVPAGCLVVALMRMPAGAASTASATLERDADYAIPYGASMGVLARVEEGIDGDVPNDSAAQFLSARISLPTNRNVTMAAYLCVSTPEKDGQTGVASVRFFVDGQRYTTRKIEYTQNWITYEPTAALELDAGDHVLGIAMVNQTGPGFVAHYGEGSGFDAGDNYVGRVLRIDDEGPAR